jgi:hypothetical protein
MTVTANSRLRIPPNFIAPMPNALVQHGYLPQPQSRSDSSRDVTQTITHPLTRVIIKMVFVVVVLSPFLMGAISFQCGHHLLRGQMTADNLH